MTNSIPKTIQQIYAAVCNGDPMTDGEIKNGIDFYSRFVTECRLAGPVFLLAEREARRVLSRLEDFHSARLHK